MRKGYIYLIENDFDDNKYVGQTARDIQTRFHEHITDTQGHSYLHSAMQKYGYQHFSIKILEEVPIEQLDIKEKEWIKKLDTYNNGYNLTLGGSGINQNYNNIYIVEKDFYVYSKEYLCRLISNITSWSIRFLTNKISNIINTEQDFLGYHFKTVRVDNTQYFTDENILEDWIKTLNIIYTGKHIHCNELNKDFETIAEASQYLLNNNLYHTTSKTPIQSVITSINKNLKGKTTHIEGIEQNYTFEYIPGTTKQTGSKTPFQKTKIYCPQLDMTFNSQEEAGRYFIDNKIWTGIKFKTAKLRISDVVRGAFPDYKGYTFEYRD